jgi:hypothetical protein
MVPALLDQESRRGDIEIGVAALYPARAVPLPLPRG